jgi:archaellin
MVLTILAIVAITAGVCVKKKCMTTIERGESKADSGVDDTYEEVDSFVERQITMERNPVYAHITLNPLKQEQDVSDAVDTASMQSSESTSDYVDVSQSESDSESYEERVTIERSPAYSSVSNPPQLNRTQIQGATIEQYLVISNSPGMKGSTDDECTDCSNEPGYYGTYITLST